MRKIFFYQNAKQMGNTITPPLTPISQSQYDEMFIDIIHQGRLTLIDIMTNKLTENDLSNTIKTFEESMDGTWESIRTAFSKGYSLKTDHALSLRDLENKYYRFMMEQSRNNTSSLIQIEIHNTELD